MKKGRIVFWLIAIGVIAAVALTRPWNRRQETLDRYAQETLHEFTTRLSQTPVYSGENAAYLDDLSTAAHPHAWSQHHRIDADQQVLIDVPEYEKAMLRAMIAQARAESGAEVAEALSRVLYEWYEAE